MSVYIDKANLPFRKMIMCHMIADNLEELHQMADNGKSVYVVAELPHKVN